MRRICNILVGLWGSESGSALVEMTIITPLALLLMAGVVDFGMAFSTQATADKSVKDAARYLSSLPASVYCPTSSTNPTNWATTNAQNLAVYGNTAGTDPQLISSWNPANGQGAFSATCNLCSGTANCSLSPSGPQYVVTVSATVPYQSIVVGSLFPIEETYNLSALHEERVVGN
jgi:Flp pilus assembly protein TadG